MTDQLQRIERLRQMRAWLDREIETELKLLGAPLGANSLIQRAAALYGVAPADLLIQGNGRSKVHVSKARQSAAWLLHEAGLSYPQIGVLLGYADHTSALYACRRIDAAPAWRALLVGLKVAS
jgi:chromosomal replication initiation ATPase DnaA